MSKTFQPLGDNVLVEPAAPPQSRRMGVVNPSAQDDKPTRGIIVNIGPAVKDKRLLIGADVEWRKYSGVEKRIDGKDCILLREDELVGTWEEDYE